MGKRVEVLPVLPSRKQQAYEFIRRYLLSHGRSPTMEDIAIALGVSDTRAKTLVKKLTAEKRIVRPPGGQRAITIPGLIEQHLLDRLHELGVVVNDDFLNHDTFPKGKLPVVAIIEHTPDVI
jgi:SOS-response transcriptional repressor LexA